MCYSPIQIPNNRTSYRLEVDKMFLTVPCGHCLDCLRQKRDDWFVRLVYEMNRTKDTCVLFPTFTYNDEHYPFLDLSDKMYDWFADMYNHIESWVDEDGVEHDRIVELPRLANVPSFDKEGFQKMLKKLRHYCDIDFKYFVVSEYGGDSSRPHYHALFFFPCHVDDSWFKTVCEFAWSTRVPKSEVPVDLIRQAKQYFGKLEKKHKDGDLWQGFYAPERGFYNYLVHRSESGRLSFLMKNGFVSYSTDHGAYVKSNKCLEYITKYLAKDQKYLDNWYISDLKYFVKNHPGFSTVINKNKKTILKNIHNIFPFTLASQGLGDNLRDMIEHSLSLDRKNTILDRFGNKKSLDIDGSKKLYAVPQYIARKILYSSEQIHCFENLNQKINHDENDYKTVSLLTEVGKEVFKFRASLRISRMSENFKIFLSSSYYGLVKDILHDFNNKVESDCKIKILNQLRSQSKLLCDFELLSNYFMYYQNLPLYYYTDSNINVFDWNAEHFKQNGSIILDYNISTYNDVNRLKNAPMKNVKTREFFKRYRMMNDLEIFNGFDDTLTYINFCRNMIVEARSKGKEASDKIGQRLKNYFNSINYVQKQTT